MALEKEKLGLYNHCFLDVDGARSHLRLAGKITILTVFVEYENAMWDTASQNKYMDACKQACQDVQHDAAGRGIPLELNQCRIFYLSKNAKATPHNRLIKGLV